MEVSQPSNSVLNYLERQPKQELPSLPLLQSSLEKKSQSPSRFGKLLSKDSDQLFEENRHIRIKLKDLSKRLDRELEKAAQQRLREQSQRVNPPTSEESQALELQNAKKIIDRLQKTVKDFESKEGYQVTLKRVMDLEGIVHKKDEEILQLKAEIKTQRHIVKEKQRQIDELLANAQAEPNPTQGLQAIKKLKKKLQKLVQQCDILRKKEQEKHNKLLSVEQKLTQLESRSYSLQAEMNQQAHEQELKEVKGKYQEAIHRLQQQNIQIAKLNQQLALQVKLKANQRRRRQGQKDKQEEDQQHKTQIQKPNEKQPVETRRNYSISLDALPKPKAHFNLFPEHKSWK